MANELAFFIQLLLIGLFLYRFAKKQHKSFLESSFLVFFFLINIFSNFEIKAFGFFITSIEPIAIGMYFLGIILYSFNKEEQDGLIKNLFKINIMIIGLLLSISFYQGASLQLILLAKNLFYNFSVSLISFSISYFLERKIYENTRKIFLNTLAQTFSVVCSQFIDTAFYTILIFYQKPLNVILSVFFFSYIIKLFCIFIYTGFLFLNKN